MVKKIVMFLAVVSSVILPQVNLEDQYLKAEKMFQQGNYFDAITEYKRLVFFDKENEYSHAAYFQIAAAYKFGGFFDNSARYFTKALAATKSADKKFLIQTEIIRVNLLRRSFENAERIIAALLKKETNTERINELLYWRGWSEMFSYRWEEASATFGQISPGHELKKISDDVLNSEYDVLFAKVISYIIPGSGQFYSGEYISGILSLGWCALWGYDTITAFANDRVFDGIVVGNLLWLRFYRGNVENAEKFAKEKNQQIYNDTVEYLLTKFEGIRP